ncbi:Amidohydrolase [Rhodospirillaceae bacterium LM-1]|nr:Amidohydrolase [Rhodospirillaceae bacterium LM-1]
MFDTSAHLVRHHAFDLVGGRVLLSDGKIVETSLSIENGCIASIGGDARHERILDVRNSLILPGIVDLHGDAFERQLMPRPGVAFDSGLALIDTDRQLVANGITTAYHGLTWSWEPGLRGTEAAHAFLQALTDVRPHLLADARLHLRHETYNLDAELQILAWLGDGRIDLLAFNDHMAHIGEKLDKPDRLAQFAGRTGLGSAEFLDLYNKVKERAGEVEQSIMRLADAARLKNVPMASHDDESKVDRAWFHALGCNISEFPVDEATAGFAIANQDCVILGAPNVLRGQSHCGRLMAAEMAERGLCTALASDYYYPALFHAPFKLAREGRMTLAGAWTLVSANPAQAVGLNDRGKLETGRRADILIVDDSTKPHPTLNAVVSLGLVTQFSRSMLS